MLFRSTRRRTEYSYVGSVESRGVNIILKKQKKRKRKKAESFGVFFTRKKVNCLECESGCDETRIL